MEKEIKSITGRDILKVGDVVYISETEYNNTSRGYKGIWDAERWDLDNWSEIRQNYIGHRTFMPPMSLFGRTCLLVEDHNFKIVPDAKFKRILKRALSK